MPANLPASRGIRPDALLPLVQATLNALKARILAHAAAEGIPFVSSNDIITALAWLVFNDAHGLQHPGQGRGRLGMIASDLARNGLPSALLSPGFFGNLVVVRTQADDGMLIHCQAGRCTQQLQPCILIS